MAYVYRSVAPPGFCNRGSEVWVYRGSRVRSPPVPVVLSVYQRGSLLDGLAMYRYLSCDTKKFHDNESTHILHNFWTSTHRGEASPPSPWWRHWYRSLNAAAHPSYLPPKHAYAFADSLRLATSHAFSVVGAGHFRSPQQSAHCLQCLQQYTASRLFVARLMTYYTLSSLGNLLLTRLSELSGGPIA